MKEHPTMMDKHIAMLIEQNKAIDYFENLAEMIGIKPELVSLSSEQFLELFLKTNQQQKIKAMMKTLEESIQV